LGWLYKKQKNSFWVGNTMKKVQLALKLTCYELHFPFGGTYIKNEENKSCDKISKISTLCCTWHWSYLDKWRLLVFVHFCLGFVLGSRNWHSNRFYFLQKIVFIYTWFFILCNDDHVVAMGYVFWMWNIALTNLLVGGSIHCHYMLQANYKIISNIT